MGTDTAHAPTDGTRSEAVGWWPFATHEIESKSFRLNYQGFRACVGSLLQDCRFNYVARLLCRFHHESLDICRAGVALTYPNDLWRFAYGADSKRNEIWVLTVTGIAAVQRIVRHVMVQVRIKGRIDPEFHSRVAISSPVVGFLI